MKRNINKKDYDFRFWFHLITNRLKEGWNQSDLLWEFLRYLGHHVIGQHITKRIK